MCPQIHYIGGAPFFHLKQFHTIHVTLSEIYEQLITIGDPYRQEKFKFSLSQKHKKVKFAQVLTTRGGIKCGVQAKYFNYMLERHLDADIYIRTEKDPIIYEHNGTVCGILMPFTLDKK